MANRTCTIDGCDKTPRSSGADWCPMHYHRWYRHGDPLYTTPPKPRKDLTGQRFGMLTVVARDKVRYWICECDCGETTKVAAGDLNRGTISTCGDRSHWWSDTACYSAAHDRVRRKHGRAADHPCLDCDEPAAHWSYDHSDPDERTEDGMPYSLNPDHYVPRCVPCHKNHDLARLNG